MTQWGVLAAILAGARHRAKGTSTPRHISSCGPPAAHISYLKPEQICWEHKPAVPLENSDKADAKAQAQRGEGWEQGWGRCQPQRHFKSLLGGSWGAEDKSWRKGIFWAASCCCC